MTVDMSKTIIAKTDQLNSENLIGGPLTGKITRVFATGSAEQPIGVDLDSWPQPWKPSKSMRRVLVDCWGVDGDSYVGKSVRLFRNPDVRFGGICVGGIECSALSHIVRSHTIALTVSKGKKRNFVVEPLRDVELEKKTPEPKANSKELDELRQKMVIESDVLALSEQMAKVADTAGMDACRATFSKLSSKITAEQRTALVALADAAKLRIAVPVVPADVAAAGKGELL